MKRDEPGNLDLLAAGYVIGTLTGGARRAFERRIGRDPFVLRRVQGWEERLVPLSLALSPVEPSPAVWAAVQKRIGAGAGPSRWRALAAALATVAVLGIGWLVWDGLRPREPQATAMLAIAEGAPLWRVDLAADGDHMEIEAVGTVAYPADRSRELWALPTGGAPVSLGLLPKEGRIRVALDDRQRAALAQSTQVAVSDEPQGGSPTGTPTGAVLGVAPLT
jgi:anti-sigma-K factor RskA